MFQQNRSVTPPLQLDSEKKCDEELVDRDKGHGEITHQLPLRAKQTSFGEKIWFINNQLRVG